MVFNAEDINIIADIEKSAGCKLHNNRQKLSNQFDVIRKLGQGTYGKVHLAVNKDTGQQVAIKSIKKNKIESESDLISIQREIQLMSSVQHPHIIHIYEVLENREKIVLVMEFASGGELYDYLSFKKVFEEDAARKYFRQVAAAVYYCHKNMICHRDLKLENILLDEKGNAKIADFGLSNIFDDKNLHRTFCGSPLYASPEMVQGKPYYGPEVDCWSLGVLLYTLVYGAMPFDGSNFKKLVQQISQGEYYEPKKTSSASVLIKRMLTVNPSKRATIEDICEDDWVNCGTELPLTTVAQEFCDRLPVRLDYILSLGAVNEAITSGEDEEEEPSLSLNISDSDQNLNRNAEDGIVSSQSDLATINEGSLDSPFPEEATEPEDMTEENEEPKLEEITKTLDSGSYLVVDDSSGEKDVSGSFEISDAELGEASEKVPEVNDKRLGESLVPEENLETGNEIETEVKSKDLDPELKLIRESEEQEAEPEESVPEKEIDEIIESKVPNEADGEQSVTTAAELVLEKVDESSALDKTELIEENEKVEESSDEITMTEESGTKSSEILPEPIVTETVDEKLELELEEIPVESSDSTTLNTETEEVNIIPAELEPEVEPVISAKEENINENEVGTFEPEENLLESKVIEEKSSKIKHEEKEPTEVPSAKSIGSENIIEDITEIKSEKSEKILKRSQSSFEEKSIKSSETIPEKELPIKVQTSETISSENILEESSEKSSEESEKILKRSQSSFEKDEVPKSKEEITSVRSEKLEKFQKKSQNSFEKSSIKSSSEILPERQGSRANISETNIVESSVKSEEKSSEKVLKRSQSSFEKSSPEVQVGSKSVLSKNIMEDVSSSVKKSEKSEKVLIKSQNSFEKSSFENGSSSFSSRPSTPLSETGTKKKLTRLTEDNNSDLEPSGYSMIRTKFRKLHNFGSMEEKEYMESVQGGGREPEIQHCDSFNSSGSNEDFDDFFDSLDSSAMFSNLLDHTQKIMNKFRAGKLDMSSRSSSSTVSRQFSRSSSREQSLRSSSIWSRSSGLEDFFKRKEKALDDHFSFSKNLERHSPTMKRPLRTRTVDLDMREEPEILRRPISTSSGSINRQSPQMQRFNRFERADLERGTSLEDHWSQRREGLTSTSRYKDLSESWNSPSRTPSSPRGTRIDRDDISESWNLPSAKQNSRGRTTDFSDESWNSTKQNLRGRVDADESWNLSSKTRNSRLEGGRGSRAEELSESWNLPSSKQNSRGGRKDPMSSLMDSMDDPKQVLRKAKELCNTYKKKI